MVKLARVKKKSTTMMNWACKKNNVKARATIFGGHHSLVQTTNDSFMVCWTNRSH